MQKHTSKQFSRSERVAATMQRELVHIIQHEIKDPRLPKFVNISNIHLSHDLSHAKVYITVLGTEEEIATTMNILAHASGYIRTKLAKIIKLRIAPQLHFIHDTSLEKAEHLLDLINHVVKENKPEE